MEAAASAAMAGGAGGRDPLVASEIHGFLTSAGRPATPQLERRFSVPPSFSFCTAILLLALVLYLFFDVVRLSSGVWGLLPSDA